MTEDKGAFEFDENLARQLNVLFATQALQQLRRQYLDFFAPSAGESVLDIGCGTAANAIAVAEFLSGDCKITGIDSSEPMLAIGRHNVATSPYGEKISLKHGDAHHLPFEDERFDSAMMIQVLEYSKEPVRMLQEARRILKNDGKLFVADTDWDTIVWNSNQKEKTRRIVHLWSDHEADGWQGRKISEYLNRAGFSKTRGQIFTMTETTFDETDYNHHLAQIISDYLVRSEKMRAEELDDWKSDLAGKFRSGHFYFSLNRYAFVAVK